MKGNGLDIDGLKSFIEKAIKLGKYPSNTGAGYSAAVKTAERALLNDEPRTLDYLLGHLEELFVRQNVNLSPQSIPIYVGRVKTVLSDYKTYGVDGSAIYNWNRKKRTQKTKGTKGDSGTSKVDQEEKMAPPDAGTQFASASNPQKLNLLSWRIRPGLMIRIELPEDLTDQDVNKIKALLDVELKFGH